jgi:hypothetical protein
MERGARERTDGAERILPTEAEAPEAEAVTGG